MLQDLERGATKLISTPFLPGEMDIPLPLDKLSLGTRDQDSPSDGVTKNLIYVVLLATGSFNPPTYMHLRMFELAKDALNSEGYYVIGGYMSPVNDAYKKRGLISAEHRIQMCDLACKSSSFIMVDSWEAKQSSFQRSLTVLARIRSCLSENGLISGKSLRIMLVCGSDLLESFSIPGAWIREQKPDLTHVQCPASVPGQIHLQRLWNCLHKERRKRY